MVDAADHEKVEASRNELHNLLDKPQLQGIPVSRPTLRNCYEHMQMREFLYMISQQTFLPHKI